MLNYNKNTQKPSLKYKKNLITAHICLYRCGQLSYTTHHGTVLIIFTLSLQKIIQAQTLSTKKEGELSSSTWVTHIHPTNNVKALKKTKSTDDNQEIQKLFTGLTHTHAHAHAHAHIHAHTRTHPFNGPFSRTTWVSQYQKGKTNLDFTEARDSEWQWHQLGHMQVCISLSSLLYPNDSINN